MMSETINAVVNNIWDRLNEIIELVKPAVETVNAVSVAVVQETAMAGFAYVALGVIALILGIPFILCSIRASRRAGEAEDAGDKGGKARHDCVFGWMIALGIVSCIIGVASTLANLGSWLAPTREVLREIMVYV